MAVGNSLPWTFIYMKMYKRLSPAPLPQVPAMGSRCAFAMARPLANLGSAPVLHKRKRMITETVIGDYFAN